MSTGGKTNIDFEIFMQKMWTDYIRLNPQAEKIHRLFQQNGEQVQNDHIALRTFNHPKLGLSSLAGHFLNFGYRQAEQEYFFKEKKLYARHFEHPDHGTKIFISELELDKVSPFVRETINNCIEQIPPAALAREDFVYSGKHWVTSYQTYQKLAAESEYAAWVYAYGFRPNHFTVSINALRSFTDINQLNAFLKMHNFKLNTSGGEVKGTPSELLEQSSTMAAEIPVQFGDGVYLIPGCYYEFAKRYPTSDGRLYQGFIAKSADKIFESTNRS